MNAIWIVVFALAGLAVGAVTWVVARNQAGKRALSAPLPCASGDASFGAGGWLPLFGVGTARVCPAGGHPQSNRRLAFELAVAAYWGMLAWRLDDWRQLLAAALFSAPLFVILLVDAWTRLIHVDTIAAGAALGLVFAAAGGLDDLLDSALGLLLGAGIFVFFFVLAMVIYRNPKVIPFGLGDVYLAGMIGAMVTLDEVVRALVYGVFLAGFSVLVLLALKRVDRKQAVPYGPFLVAGALLALLV